MASILPQIQKAITAGFRGRLAKGMLARPAAAAVNVQGDQTTITYTNFPCEGIREDFSAWYRQQAGIPEEDVKILLIAGLVKTVPQKDDLIQMPLNGPWYRIRKIMAVDPATATYSLQGFPAAGPV